MSIYLVISITRAAAVQGSTVHRLQTSSAPMMPRSKSFMTNTAGRLGWPKGRPRPVYCCSAVHPNYQDLDLKVKFSPNIHVICLETRLTWSKDYYSWDWFRDYLNLIAAMSFLQPDLFRYTALPTDKIWDYIIVFAKGLSLNVTQVLSQHRIAYQTAWQPWDGKKSSQWALKSCAARLKRMAPKGHSVCASVPFAVWPFGAILKAQEHTLLAQRYHKAVQLQRLLSRMSYFPTCQVIFYLLTWSSLELLSNGRWELRGNFVVTGGNFKGNGQACTTAQRHGTHLPQPFMQYSSFSEK